MMNTVEKIPETRVNFADGDYCMGQNRQGLWLRGRILDRRRLPSSTEGSYASADWECFFLFDGKDWKFAEWLTDDKLKTEEEVSLNLNLDADTDGEGGRRRRSRRLSTTPEEKNENEKGDEAETEDVAGLKDKIRYVEVVKVGKYEIRTWYAAPFNQQKDVRLLYFCEYCLRFTSDFVAYKHHWHACPSFGPPGKEIYRMGEISIREVDGAKDTFYCQCLCLLGNAFIDHKKLVFSVEGFMFYVLVEVDIRGEHLVGYFSKDKLVTDGSMNLSCIMVLPPYQGKGYGQLLIDLSYRMSRITGQPGTPERPISNLGILSYTSYWRWVVLSHIKDMHEQSVRIELGRLAKLTGISEGDIIKILRNLGFVVREDSTGRKTIVCTTKLIEECIDKYKVKRPKILVRTDCLGWVPPPPPEPEQPKPEQEHLEPEPGQPEPEPQ